VVTVAGQVLDISKHENIARSERPARAAAEKRSARLYRFPSPAHEANKVGPAPKAKAQRIPGTWRSRLAIELAIGFTMWLIWFWWRMLH
jgi:hypothetical protein